MKVLVLFNYTKHRLHEMESDGKVVIVQSSKDILKAFVRAIRNEGYRHFEITGYLTECGKPTF